MAGGTGTQPTPNSVLLPGSTRVSGRASALLGVAGPSLATHRPLLCGGPTYYYTPRNSSPDSNSLIVSHAMRVGVAVGESLERWRDFRLAQLMV